VDRKIAPCCCNVFGGPLKVSMLGGPLEGSNVWWPMEGERGTLFTFSHFLPNKFYLNLFFSIDFKVLLYHGSRPLLTPFLHFP